MAAPLATCDHLIDAAARRIHLERPARDKSGRRSGTGRNARSGPGRTAGSESVFSDTTVKSATVQQFRDRTMLLTPHDFKVAPRRRPQFEDACVGANSMTAFQPRCRCANHSRPLRSLEIPVADARAGARHRRTGERFHHRAKSFSVHDARTTAPSGCDPRNCGVKFSTWRQSVRWLRLRRRRLRHPVANSRSYGGEGRVSGGAEGQQPIGVGPAEGDAPPGSADQWRPAAAGRQDPIARCHGIGGNRGEKGNCVPPRAWAGT